MTRRPGAANTSTFFAAHKGLSEEATIRIAKEILKRGDYYQLEETLDLLMPTVQAQFPLLPGAGSSMP